LLLSLLQALLLSLVTPARAYAHGALRRAVPASNGRVSTAPRELRLTFTERVELAVARLTLAGPGGPAVELMPLATAPDSGNVLVAAIRGPLVAGAYTVTWQVAGRDGHAVRGRYTFTILPGATGVAARGAALSAAPDTPAAPTAAAAGEAGAAVAAPGQAAPPAAHHPATRLAGATPSDSQRPADTAPTPGDVGGAFDAGSPAYVAVRWLTYVALLLVLGAVTFRTAVLGLVGRGAGGAAQAGVAASDFASDAGRRAATLGLWGAVGLLAAAAARLGAQSVAMHGAAALDPARVLAMLGHTVWGWGWVLQVGGAALAALGFAAARRRGTIGGPVRGAFGRAWAAAAAGALLLAFTPALSGHAAASRYAPLAVLSDGLHVLGAGGWLGGLLVVLAAGVPAAAALGAEWRGAAVAALVRAFSPAALGFAALVAVTGVLAGWLHVGRLPALWETGYGRILLVKLAALSLVAAAGAYNWLRVRPALGGDAGTRRIRRSATAELAVGVFVLLATAALVATPTPVDVAAPQEEATFVGRGAPSGR
jgi:copper transport protein